ncbi:hemerythrin domain-containing protein [Paraburkholderia hospita]|uniref:hemerythrin domain-containing protein n=1 Tax=Paraburkholderia hospita TaxID=169430 RepID=UPI000B341BEE|nr:hemerythrin domain-containing protein [Paraburkholderia hospita]OUL86288.1 cation-binding protein [Paraburkholderia hospita]
MPYVPTITTMIRLDHTHVVAAFHRYGSETAWWRKRAIVTFVCRALEIHAQLEEEIFYPALAPIAPTDETLKKSRPEHDALREVIGKLRNMGPENAAYDSLFMELMRDTLHHVADEETRLLPLAERALGPELRTLGAEMTRRRLQLLGEHPVEVAVNTAGTFPVATAVLVALLACGVARLVGGNRRPARMA